VCAIKVSIMSVTTAFSVRKELTTTDLLAHVLQSLINADPIKFGTVYHVCVPTDST